MNFLQFHISSHVGQIRVKAYNFRTFSFNTFSLLLIIKFTTFIQLINNNFFIKFRSTKYILGYSLSEQRVNTLDIDSL